MRELGCVVMIIILAKLTVIGASQLMTVTVQSEWQNRVNTVQEAIDAEVAARAKSVDTVKSWTAELMSYSGESAKPDMAKVSSDY